ncbi:hypothetical protein ABPG75_010582 [Micractinium tetrahymenae]
MRAGSQRRAAARGRCARGRVAAQAAPQLRVSLCQPRAADAGVLARRQQTCCSPWPRRSARCTSCRRSCSSQSRSWPGCNTWRRHCRRSESPRSRRPASLDWHATQYQLPVACCKLPHALGQLSDSQLALLGLAPAAGQLHGRLCLAAAMQLQEAVVHASGLLHSAQMGVEADGGNPEWAALLAREHACCVLQCTAALAGPYELGGSQAPADGSTATAPSHAALSNLKQALLPSRTHVRKDEQGVLKGLASFLPSSSPDAAADKAHLQALLARLLRAAEAGGEGGGAGPASQPPLPAGAALLQARALGQTYRRCTNVRCPPCRPPKTWQRRGASAAAAAVWCATARQPAPEQTGRCTRRHAKCCRRRQTVQGHSEVQLLS